MPLNQLKMNRRKNPLLSRMNLTQYFANIRERQQATCVITPDKSFYIHRGQEIPILQFESMYPLEIIVTNEKGAGIDGRTNFY